MRSFQWLVVLACVSLLALLTACPRGGDSTADNSSTTATQSNDKVDVQAAEELFNKNCSICHGASREGRPDMSPPLTDVKTNWHSPDELVKYLQNPQGYADKDPRLNANREKYSLRMPDIPTMSDEERRTLALWLLQ